ncbi:hypothetical protein HN587_02345 [Candidatus Woesearchaeota archaeon]|jgi:hypothetical protein|nr:hypothetical protein [Candidatus Woesearchaeota archaeon]
MPPSGFNQNAINGLLEFVRANYASLQSKYESDDRDISEKDFLDEQASFLESRVAEQVSLKNVNLDTQGVMGIVTFVAECYKDLAGEVTAGVDKYGRPVIDGAAIKKELTQISNYLTQFRI